MCRLIAERLRPRVLGDGEAAALDDGLEDAQQADIEIPADLAERRVAGFGHYCFTQSKLNVRKNKLYLTFRQGQA